MLLRFFLNQYPILFFWEGKRGALRTTIITIETKTENKIDKTKTNWHFSGLFWKPEKKIGEFSIKG